MADLCGHVHAATTVCSAAVRTVVVLFAVCVIGAVRPWSGICSAAAAASLPILRDFAWTEAGTGADELPLFSATLEFGAVGGVWAGAYRPVSLVSNTHTHEQCGQAHSLRDTHHGVCTSA